MTRSTLLLFVSCAAFALAGARSLAQEARPAAQAGQTPPASAAPPTQAPATPDVHVLYERIGATLTHPRCLNCHQNTFPRQKETGIRHLQMVVRGKDGHGAETLQCAACHQATNTADGKVPGVPGWHLAPRPMSWEGLSAAGICKVITDPAKNGNRKTPHEIIEHMKVDPLVLWAWNPGAGRSTPVISHEAFVKDLEAWAAAGAPCPKE